MEDGEKARKKYRKVRWVSGVFMRTVERDGVGCVGCGGWEAGYDVKLHRSARVFGARALQTRSASASVFGRQGWGGVRGCLGLGSRTDADDFRCFAE